MASSLDTKQLLDDLAIHYSRDTSGGRCLEIDLISDPASGISSCKAVFDEALCQWRLVPSTVVKASTPQYTNIAETATKVSPTTNLSQSWTNHLPESSHTELFVRDLDWNANPLGPLDSWPVLLRSMCLLAFVDPEPTIIYWGPDKRAIYNQPAADQLSGTLRKDARHFMGMPFKVIWPELYSEFTPMFDAIASTGEAITSSSIALFPADQDGILQETYWDGSFLPIFDDSGTTAGFFNHGMDVTKRVLQDRWNGSLSAIAAPSDVRDASIWEHIFNVFASCGNDFPLAFAYSAEDDITTRRCTLQLQKSIGVPPGGHTLVPSQSDLYEGAAGFTPFYRKAKVSERAVVLHKSDGTLHDELLQGFEWQGFQEQSRSLAIVPVSSGDRLLGLVVFGLNPRRPFDTDYSTFINIFTRQLSTTIASALDREESRRRAERLTKQLAHSEKQIRDLAEYGPVGIVRVAPVGTIIWANPQYYQITGHATEADRNYEGSFLDILDEIDRPVSEKLWETLMTTQQSVSVALRLKKKWQPPSSLHMAHPDQEPVWVLTSAYPVFENGQLSSVAAAVVDISAFKWAETVQIRVAKDAEDAKRLQEAFIDVVSHEMRNPLSAITQLADGIAASLDELLNSPEDTSLARDIIRENAEGGKTILLCAAHQKRIIDDVLTLSKLDSMMLSITPVAVQPQTVVDSVLKMFDAELTSNAIKTEHIIEQSYLKHSIEWVYLDPSRLTQIFINLITNAIKFTRFETTRRIRIRSNAFLEKPISKSGISWFPSVTLKKDLTANPEWGDGQPIYLMFEVLDTGKGLESNETTKLFNRFQQASAKTHIKYGGSGLGLYISRELTEMQGGEIGVFSAPGKGSNFAFYIKTKRAKPPPDFIKTAQATTVPPVPNRNSLRIHPTIVKDNGISALKRPCILLVEDNLVNAQVLTKQLKKAGCDVHLANHGGECLDKLTNSRVWRDNTNDSAVDYDCILMDVEMPVMDGLTATRHIRKQEKEGFLVKHVQIIAITANARAEQIREALDAGCDSVQPKPFRVQELLDRLQDVQGL